MDIFASLSSLYARLPQVNCLACGQCCVSPSCTLVEFLYLVAEAQRVLSREQFRQSVLLPALDHPHYEGNQRCIFLVDGRCSVHAGRAGACRLFGLAAVRELGVNDMVYCKNDIESQSTGAGIGFLRDWLDGLAALDRSLYAYNIAPFFIKGFPLHCWLDIYFDESFETDVFGDIRAAMRNYINLSDLGRVYDAQTGLKEKVDKISILWAMAGNADPAVVRPLLLSIRNDYPKTGIYYVAEADRLLADLDPDGQD